MPATLAKSQVAKPLSVTGEGHSGWGHVLALGLLAVLLAALTTGWFSADEVVMRQQAEVLAQGEWTLAPDAESEALDPEHAFALLARSDRIGSEIAPYTKHPLAALVFAIGFSVAGGFGLYLPGVAGLIGAALIFHRSFERTALAFWLPVVGTTALFHLTTVWAHLPAFSLAATSVLLAFGSDRVDARRLVGAAFVVGVVALLRSEGLLLAAAMSVGLLAMRPTGRVRSASFAPLGVAIAVYLLEPVGRRLLFGGAPGPLGAPVAGSASESFLVGRIEVGRVMFFEPAIAGGLGPLRLIGLILLVAASAGWRAGRLAPSTAGPILAGAVACYGVAVLASPIPGLLVAMPLIAALLPWVELDNARERAAVTAAAAFAVAVVLTSYDNAGGGDWGARYLFIGVPLLLLVVIPAASRVRRDAPVLLGGAFLCALIVQFGILFGVLGRSQTVRTVDSVVQAVEDERSADADLVVAVSDERLARFLYDRGLRGAAFHVPPARETDFDDLIGTRPILWVDLGATADARSGTIVDTVGSVVIRTEVRR